MYVHIDEGAPPPPPPPGPSTPIAESPDDHTHHHHGHHGHHHSAPAPHHSTPYTDVVHAHATAAAAAAGNDASSSDPLGDYTTGPSSDSVPSSPVTPTPSAVPLPSESQGFLPPSPETAHVPLPHTLASPPLEAVTIHQGPLPAFEFRALEGILRYTPIAYTHTHSRQSIDQSHHSLICHDTHSFVCRKYDLRISCFQPVITSLLVDLHSRDSEPSAEMLHRLLPLKNSLSAFERVSNELIDCLGGVLASDKAMTAMFLTEKKRKLGNQWLAQSSGI